MRTPRDRALLICAWLKAYLECLTDEKRPTHEVHLLYESYPQHPEEEPYRAHTFNLPF